MKLVNILRHAINVNYFWLIIYSESYCSALLSRFALFLRVMCLETAAFCVRQSKRASSWRYFCLFVCFQSLLFSSQQQMIKKLTLERASHDGERFCVMKTRIYVYLSLASRWAFCWPGRHQKTKLHSQYFCVLIGLWWADSDKGSSWAQQCRPKEIINFSIFTREERSTPDKGVIYDKSDGRDDGVYSKPPKACLRSPNTWKIIAERIIDMAIQGDFSVSRSRICLFMRIRRNNLFKNSMLMSESLARPPRPKPFDDCFERDWEISIRLLLRPPIAWLIEWASVDRCFDLLLRENMMNRDW